MDTTQRTFSLILAAAIVLVASAGMAASMPEARIAAWALGPLAFLVLLAMSIFFRRRGLDPAWMARAGLAGAGGLVLLQAALTYLRMQALAPVGQLGGQSPIWMLLSIPGALIGVALPVVLGSLLGAVPDTRENRPGFLSLPPWRPTLLIGLLPLMHIVLFIRGGPGHLEYPSLAVLFFAAPIGLLMALVGLVLSAVRQSYGPVVVVGALAYGLAATLTFLGMSAAGVRFTFPP